MLVNGVYNKAVYWPKELDNLVKAKMGRHYPVFPTRHYESKCCELHLPLGIYKVMLHGEIIEAEIYNGAVRKIVTRLNNRGRPCEDICAAIAFGWHSTYNREYASVKTVWINRVNDNHATINFENYIMAV